MSSGQGHETSFPQLISEWLRIPSEKIRFVANDTNRVSVGGGSHSGRSMRLVSIAANDAVKELLAKGKEIAARMMQASPPHASEPSATPDERAHRQARPVQHRRRHDGGARPRDRRGGRVPHPLRTGVAATPTDSVGPQLSSRQTRGKSENPPTLPLIPSAFTPHPPSLSPATRTPSYPTVTSYAQLPNPYPTPTSPLPCTPCYTNPYPVHPPTRP